MITSPFNNIIVTIKSKWVSNPTKLAKIASIQAGSSVELADLVTLTGTVVSIPKSLSNKREYAGFSTSNIRVGDNIIFSHDVVSNMKQLRPDELPVHRNEFWYKGQTYWTVRIDNLYAVIRDGEIIMQNSYVMVAPPETQPQIYLLNHQKRQRGAFKSEIMHIGNQRETEEKIDATDGDFVFYSPNVLRKYEINEKKFGIIKTSQILGVEKN